MIGKLIGLIDEIERESVIMNVNGVGYQVFCPENIISNFKIGDQHSLYIQTHIREDNLQLFGFDSKAQKDLFILLRSVSGVGNKTALCILAQMRLDDIRLAITSNDKKLFTMVPGIGSKTAERIIIELKNHKMFSGITYINSGVDSSKMQDAISALFALGIPRNQAGGYVNQILSSNPNSSTADIIKQALSLRSKNE